MLDAGFVFFFYFYTIKKPAALLHAAGLEVVSLLQTLLLHYFAQLLVEVHTAVVIFFRLGIEGFCGIRSGLLQ